MAKLLANSTLDDGLNDIETRATAMHVCSGDPADRAAVLTNSLATVAPTWTGPVDGDTSGRKTTSDAKAGVSITATGTAATVCWIDGSTLLAKSDVNPTQALTSGGTVDIPAIDIEYGDPT